MANGKKITNADLMDSEGMKDGVTDGEALKKIFVHLFEVKIDGLEGISVTNKKTIDDGMVGPKNNLGKNKVIEGTFLGDLNSAPTLGTFLEDCHAWEASRDTAGKANMSCCPQPNVATISVQPMQLMSSGPINVAAARAGNSMKT